MRTFWLVALLPLACHGSAAGPDAGTVTPKAAAVDSAEDEPEEDAAPPRAVTKLRPLATDAGPAPRRAKDGAILLCDGHSTWTPPVGFGVVGLHAAVVAARGDELVAVIDPPHDAESYARAAAPFVDGTLAWDAPVDAGQGASLAHGRGNGLVAVVRTRPHGDVAHPGLDVLWLAIAPTEARADELLAAARASEHALPDHACECGYDCAGRR